MVRILDYNGRDAERTVTVASIAALKGSGRQFTQVTAGTAEEAAAAAAKPTVAKSGTKKKPTTVKKDPLPQTKPADNTNRSRGDAVNPTNNRERGDAVNPTSKDATKPADNRRRGDAVKSGGGN